MPIVLKSASLKHLETSGPVQVCAGIASPFTFRTKITIQNFTFELRSLRVRHIITDCTHVYLARPCGAYSYITLIINFIIIDHLVKSWRGWHRHLLTYLLHGAESFLSSWLVLQLVKKFPAFLEPECSSPYSQVPATCPYPEPTPSSPHNPLPLPEDPS